MGSNVLGLIMIPGNIFNDITKADWSKVEKRLGQSNRKKFTFINDGCYAKVYDLAKSRILKITADRSDALSSKYFMDNPNPLVVKIHDVFELSSIGRYFIVANKLNVLDKEWERFIFTYGLPNRYTLSRLIKRFSNIEEPSLKRKLNWAKRFYNFHNSVGFCCEDLHDKNIMLDARGFPRISDLGDSYRSTYMVSESLIVDEI